MWYHPKYYEELRKKRKELERQAQATSMRKPSSDKHQASSDKRQASEQEAIKIHEAWALDKSYKHQATSSRDPDTRVLIIQACDKMSQRRYVAKPQASSSKHPESGFKQQASSAKQ
jgi:hypothetical protein